MQDQTKRAKAFWLHLAICCAVAANASVTGCGSSSSPSAPAGAAAWTQFTSDKSHFKVMLPKKPDEKFEMMPTPANIDVPRRMFSCGTSDGRGTYWIECQEFPEWVATRPDRDKLLSLAGRAVIESQGGAVRWEINVRLQDYDGKELSHEHHEGSKKSIYGLTRVFLVRNRFYMIGLSKTTSHDDVEKEAAKFFESFEFTEAEPE
ncbi:MAG: hypothetical protein HYS13_14260 [Planctomycetia bacterium]|nr:hypothetical protein [Planctomycetia bacterium]